MEATKELTKQIFSMKFAEEGTNTNAMLLYRIKEAMLMNEPYMEEGTFISAMMKNNFLVFSLAVNQCMGEEWCEFVRCLRNPYELVSGQGKESECRMEDVPFSL